MYGSAIDNRVWMRCQAANIERRRLERVAVRLGLAGFLLLVAVVGVVS